MVNQLLYKMIEYYKGDPKRIHHFIKVYELAKLIGEMEGMEEDTLEILKVAAIVHDIGIKAAEEQYGRSDGRLQEELGPDLAKRMLVQLGFEDEFSQRVCYLVGHHHTYTNIDGMDYQILIEADFLVNMYEEELKKEAIYTTYKRIFKTDTGRRLCKEMYAIEEL